MFFWDDAPDEWLSRLRAAEASNSIVDDGANHEWISTGGALLVNPGLSRPPQLGQIDILRR